jgi:hypothetical protein
VEARSVRRPLILTLSATLVVLVLSPGAYAASPDGAIGSLAGTVDQTVGAVSGVTGQVTTVVGNAAPPAQPVTNTVQDVTTHLTRQTTTTVEEITPVAGRVPPAVEKAATKVDSVTTGTAHESQPPTRPATSHAAPRVPDREPAAPGDRADPVPAHPAPRHPAEGRPLAERPRPQQDGREPVAVSRPAEAPSVSPAARPHAGDGALDPGSSAPGHDLPALVGGSASAPSSGAAVGGLALLAVAFCLTAPRLLRSLSTVPANMRPVLFVFALERPG